MALANPNNSRSASSGRIRALDRERRGLRRGRRLGGKPEGRLLCGSCILGKLHVLPRRALKWLHLISAVLITGDREPSVRGQRHKTNQPHLALYNGLDLCTKGCGGLVQLMLFSLDHCRLHSSVSQLPLPIVYWSQSMGF